VTVAAVTDIVGDVIDAIGEIGIGLLILGETFIPPIPSEVILPLAGFYVEQGRISFFGALIGATAGSLAGALALYYIGLYGGRPLVLRRRRFLPIKERDLDRAEAWFDRYGPVIVLVARVVPLARSYISIPAGTMRMNVVTFSILTALGSAVWNAGLIGAGWALGGRWEEVSDVVGTVGPIVLGVVVLACAGLLLRWWLRRRRVPQRAQP
jgi:membrane protein DedA with SNARE-associated domain